MQGLAGGVRIPETCWLADLADSGLKSQNRKGRKGRKNRGETVSFETWNFYQHSGLAKRFLIFL